MESTIRPIDQFMESLKAARRVSTPLVAIRSADPALAIERVQESVGESAPVVCWDIVRGLVPTNETGTKELAKLLGERDPTGIGPVEALVLAAQLSEDSVVLYANAQRFWADPQIAQGIWNLRDAFKANGRMLALLTTPGAVLPDELTQDVLVLDEPLPGLEALAYIWRKIRLEEATLGEAFGADYDAYRRTTWALVPSLLRGFRPIITWVRNARCSMGECWVPAFGLNPRSATRRT
jgi:hypothetical protein